MRGLTAATFFGFTALGFAQVPSGVVTTDEPVSRAGVAAVCDLPAEQHMRNRGGNDRTRDNPRGEPGKGYGLCVFTSVEVAARWQAVRELSGFQDWMTRRPGGGYPEKLDRMLAAYCNERDVPVPAYVQHSGGDESFLDLAVKTDRLPCVTYAGMDGFYKDAWGRDTWIDHMVNLAHLDADTAAVIDNNRPGVWVWMTRKDFLVRWRARGGGWAVVLLHAPPPPHPPGDRLPPRGVQDARAPGRWVPALGGGEWGYWVGNRCVARCFADGRCEAVDARGFATGVAMEPPAPLPGEVVSNRTSPAGSYPNFGVEPGYLGEEPSYSISGVVVSREEAHAALAGGPLVDDSDRWHLTAVGDARFVNRFLGDVAALPAATRSKLHIQAYAPGEWPVGLYRLPGGVSLRKPSPGRIAAEAGVVAEADYSPAKLAELLAPVTGVTPAPPPRPKPDAVPDPEVSPPPVDSPARAGPAETPAEPSALLALALAVVALVLSIYRRPA